MLCFYVDFIGEILKDPFLGAFIEHLEVLFVGVNDFLKVFSFSFMRGFKGFGNGVFRMV